MRKLWLPVILILAFLLRFINLTSFPVGFNADEASFGYDAYSILHTGKDQWGVSLPIALKSFGDYKSPLYAYLTIPSVAIFGLNPFATRLPNVFVGTLAVLSVYLLTNQIFKLRFGSYNLSLGLISAVLLSVNPWAIMMSRGAFEANLITFFLPLGIYFFIRGLDEAKYFLLSALLLGLTFFTYHSAKIIVPMTSVFLIVVYWKKIKKLDFRYLWSFGIIFTLFSLGVVSTLYFGGGSRIIERSITQGALEDGARDKIKSIQAGMNPIEAKIRHNKYQVVVSRFISNYSQYFSYRYLIKDGAGESYYGMIPGIGTIYVFEGLLLIGLIPLLFHGKWKGVMPIIIWLLIAPLPAALSTGVGYSGNRAEGMIPALQILEALGLVGWFGLIKIFDRRILMSTLFLFGIIAIWNLKGFLNKYFVGIPQSSYQQMLYGNLEVFGWLSQNRGGKQVVVSRSLSEPQIFIAFVNKWDPTDYQNNSKSWDLKRSGVSWLDQVGEYSLGKFTIKSIDWAKDKNIPGVILIAKPDDFPNGLIPDKVFYYPNGVASIYAKIY